MKRILITHEGVTRSLAAWARALGIGYGTLRKRWDQGWRGKLLFGPVRNPCHVFIIHHGVTRSLHEWAMVTGIAKGTLYTRFYKEWPSARLLNPEHGARTRSYKEQPLTSKKGVTRTLRQWAKVIGLEPRTIHNRIKRGWTVDLALRPQKSGHRFVTIGGVTRSLREWARRIGVRPDSLSRRIRLWPEARLLEPRGPRGPRPRGPGVRPRPVKSQPWHADCDWCNGLGHTERSCPDKRAGNRVVRRGRHAA